MVISYSMVSYVAPPEEYGLYMGILQVFIVLPQLLVSAVAPLLLWLFKGAVVSVLVYGGAMSAVGVPLSFLVVKQRIPSNPKYAEIFKNKEPGW